MNPPAPPADPQDDPFGDAVLAARLFTLAPRVFKGMVLLFLLEVGMMAARRVGMLARVGAPLVIFGIVAPLINGMLGIGPFPTEEEIDAEMRKMQGGS